MLKSIRQCNFESEFPEVLYTYNIIDLSVPGNFEMMHCGRSVVKC